VKNLRDFIVIHPVVEKNLSRVFTSFWFSPKLSWKIGGQTGEKQFLIWGKVVFGGESGIP